MPAIVVSYTASSPSVRVPFENWLYNAEPYPPTIFEFAVSLVTFSSVTNPKSDSLIYVYVYKGYLSLCVK